MSKRSPNGILGLGAIIGVLVCIWLIGTQTLTSTESLLLSVLLTIASILGSWVTSRVYAEASFNDNLRVFALKAAEKVNNLSNELDRLSVFLQQELDDSDYANPAEELLAKELRIEGAIHVINTLKSVNDRSLSDWQGVIGKELDAQREQQVEREEELRELVERFEALYSSQGVPEPAQREWEAAIRSELNTIRSDLRVLASQVGGIPLRRPKTQRQKITLPCPSCSHEVSFSQKLKSNSVKAHKCLNCGAPLVSRLEDGHFALRLREPILEPIRCPKCETRLTAALDPVPGSSTNLKCTSCGAEIRASRSDKGVTTRLAQSGALREIPTRPPQDTAVTEDVVEAVKAAMPPQPWPTGAAQEVALNLGLPQKVVSQAIRALMDRGEFAVQINGRLYERVSQPRDQAPNGA